MSWASFGALAVRAFVVSDFHHYRKGKRSKRCCQAPRKLCVERGGPLSLKLFSMQRPHHRSNDVLLILGGAPQPRDTETTPPAPPPQQGSELGGLSRPSRPCCSPAGSVEAFGRAHSHMEYERANWLEFFFFFTSGFRVHSNIASEA